MMKTQRTNPTHFAVPVLVDDFSRLRVVERVPGLGLGRGEEIENARGKLGIDPKGLQCGDNAVAPERGREPRYASVRVGSGRKVRCQ